MRLTSGTPFWLTRHGLPPSFPTLTEDLSCDVAVLGAGVSGALLSDALSAAGLQVVVLEKHYPGTGATAASTALLQFEVDKHLTDLRTEWGDAGRADAAYRAVYHAFRRIGQIAQELGPATVGFSPTTSLYLAGRPTEAAVLAAEVAARQAIGLPAELLTASEVRHRYHIQRPGAIFTREAAQIDALRLTLALHQRAASRGVRLFERTEVSDYAADATGVTLTTTHNFRVRARHVVVCTGYETPLWAKGIRIDLNSSFAFVTEPLAAADRWPTDCHLWETARPYTYARVLEDGRVMVGGADIPFRHATARDALLESRTRYLEKRIAALLPQLPLRVDFRWGGTFGESPDSLPYISPHPNFPRAWFALGSGGNGIVFASLAAEIITAELTGQHHLDTNLFRFDRPGIG